MTDMTILVTEYKPWGMGFMVLCFLLPGTRFFLSTRDLGAVILIMARASFILFLILNQRARFWGLWKGNGAMVFFTAEGLSRTTKKRLGSGWSAMKVNSKTGKNLAWVLKELRTQSTEVNFQKDVEQEMEGSSWMVAIFSMDSSTKVSWWVSPMKVWGTPS